eukprot:TRINITY_DN30657_c0_g1_i1.p2 TRINITY_DN30657_c0_g1~~TRINITY_DN30657_c0_g1_i1.p2  ORF type:complete len:105 (-),score=14.53 TRINITY_DN30657_c0_g1_i1:50-364(-)
MEPYTPRLPKYEDTPYKMGNTVLVPTATGNGMVLTRLHLGVGSGTVTPGAMQMQGQGILTPLTPGTITFAMPTPAPVAILTPGVVTTPVGAANYVFVGNALGDQ